MSSSPCEPPRARTPGTGTREQSSALEAFALGFVCLTFDMSVFELQSLPRVTAKIVMSLVLLLCCSQMFDLPVF